MRDTLGPRLAPRMLFRVWTNDGHEVLERGAVFNELDVRALRSDLVAAGDDPLVSNRTGLTAEWGGGRLPGRRVTPDRHTFEGAGYQQ